MARQTMRKASSLALIALVPLAVGGCSWIKGELDQLTPDGKQRTEARSEAKPLQRVARSEPSRSHSAPDHHRQGERKTDTRTAGPLPARPSEPEQKPAPATVPAPPPTRAPAFVPAPPPMPVTPAPVTPTTPPASQPRIINPSAPQPPAAVPAPAQPDPLPTEPGPPLPRQEPLPAPPNRANVTPPRQSGGGVFVAARPDMPTQQNTTQPSPAPIVLTPQAPAAGETLSKTQVALRLEHARRLLQLGKVVEARVMLHTVMRSLPSAALHELARTYDPYYLGQLPKIDDGSEPRTAASLYQDAINHGASAAGNDLDRLRASYPALR